MLGQGGGRQKAERGEQEGHGRPVTAPLSPSDRAGGLLQIAPQLTA